MIDIEPGEYFTVTSNEVDRSYIGGVFFLIGVDGDLVSVRSVSCNTKFFMQTAGKQFRKLTKEFAESTGK